MELWLVRHGPTQWSESGPKAHLCHRRAVDRSGQGSGHRRLARQARRAQWFGLVLTPRGSGRCVRRSSRLPRRSRHRRPGRVGLRRLRGHHHRRDPPRTDPGWTSVDRKDPRRRAAAAAVQERLGRVVARLAARARRRHTLVFSHGHALCALAAGWLGLPRHQGRLFRLDTATVSMLGYDASSRSSSSGTHDPTLDQTDATGSPRCGVALAVGCPRCSADAGGEPYRCRRQQVVSRAWCVVTPLWRPMPRPPSYNAFAEPLSRGR